METYWFYVEVQAGGQIDLTGVNVVGYDLEKIKERQGPEPVSPVDCDKEFTFSVLDEATGGFGKQGRPARK